jgi:hypothetical protein
MRSMPEMAAYLVRCGTNYYANPPSNCFDFGGQYNGVYDTEILDQEWNALKAFYRSAKQEIKFQLADCIALEDCNRYCGCIGNENYNPYTSGMLDSYPPFDALTYFSSPYYSYGQPCSTYLNHYFEDKVRRFTNSTSEVPIQNANQAAYEVYLATGQCPVPFTLQHLLSAMAQDDKLDNGNVILNNFPELSALFQADNDFNMPGTIPNLYQQVIVNGNALTSNWTEIPGYTIYATLELTKSSSLVNWDDITSIVNLFPTGGNSFEAQGVYSSNGTQVVSLTGSITTFDLEGCSFANECTLNELGEDLEYLLSTLANTNHLITSSDIDIEPLIPLSKFIEPDIGFVTCSAYRYNLLFNPSFIIAPKECVIIKKALEWYVTKYQSEEPYLYWAWSIMQAFTDTFTLENYNNHEGIYFYKSDAKSKNKIKVQIIQEVPGKDHADAHNLYKGMRVFNNRYKDWDHVSHRFILDENGENGENGENK